MSESVPPGYAVPPPYPLPPAPPPVEVPTPYHRLFRTNPGYAWWRPLVAAVLFGVFYLVLSVIVGVVWGIIAVATGDVDFSLLTNMSKLLAHLSDTSNPLSLAYLLASIAIMLPCVPLAMLCAGLRPVGLRHSVTFRLRWRWMLWCAIPALVITIVNSALSFVPLLFGEPFEPVPVDPGTFAILVVIILLLVPLQSAAEEYVFRGFMMQTLGAWIRPIWPLIIVATFLFTIGHTQYEIWGKLSVAVMGAGFAIVTWRTGGLEAAIALHVVNNVISFLLLTSGVLGTTVMSSEGSGPEAPLIQLVFTSAFVLWVEFAARRQGIARVRGLPA
ncbi:MAG: CPBP family intramembrane metalloprotease domain-containing protein [Leifsonia xyli]|nr:MAG: CPBP family intramembrane metalloprotease domain-containing protein [Leifsonia xyli]